MKNSNSIKMLFIVLLTFINLCAMEKLGFVTEGNQEALCRQIESFNPATTELALYLAVHDMRADALEAIIKKGVNVNVLPPDSFYMARRNQRVTMYSNNGHSGTSDATVLFVLARIGNGDNCKEIFEKLIKAGIDIHRKNGLNQLALTIAVENKNCTMTELLLTAGARIEDAECSGGTLVSPTTDQAILTLLVKAGLDINKKDALGNTALYMAAANNFTVENLIAAGADPDVSCELDKTALIIASEKGFSSLVARLLKAGAAVHCSTIAGETALSTALNQIIEIRRLHGPAIARHKEHPFITIASLLIAAGADYDILLADAAKKVILDPIISSLFSLRKIA